MKIAIGFVVAGLAIVALITWTLLRNRKPVHLASDTTFSMAIEDVFALKTMGKVVVVGVIDDGQIVPGDSLRVRVGENHIPVLVEGIEAFHRPLKSAKAGDRVGVMLQGVNKDQIRLPATLQSCDE